jgi:hypothetical protein
MFLLVGVFLFPFTVMGESLSAYTTRCESELEIPKDSIKGFTCNDAASIVLQTDQFNTDCDSHALLPGVGCMKNSRLGVKSFSNADVKAVWLCRKYEGINNPDDDLYHDIAMIIHNRKNGKTCFFQNNLTNKGPVIPGPKDAGALEVWLDPQGTVAATRDTCASCHSNDPFIVTPHVAEAFSNFGMTRFNPNGDYSVVGSEPGGDFERFAGFLKKAPGCGGLCHFNPVDFVTSEATNKHWMPPGSKPIQNYAPYKFNPLAGQFYTLHSNGDIRGFNGPSGGACNNGKCPHWSVLGSKPDTVELAASSGKLYSREIGGFIREFTGVQCHEFNDCTGWQLVDNNPKSAQIVSGVGRLYQMWHSGSIWRYTGTPCKDGKCLGWELLDNNSNTIEIVASDVNF